MSGVGQGRALALALVGMALGAGCGGGSGKGTGIGTDAGAMDAPLDVAAHDTGIQGSSDAGADAADGPEDTGPVPIPPGLSLLAGGLGGYGNADDTGTLARFAGPADIVADGAGNLYVADAYLDTVRKVVIATGVVSTVAGSPGVSGSDDGIGAAARFNDPTGVAYDGAGNLFVADGNHTVRKIVLATEAVTTLAGSVGQSGTTDGTGAAARFDGPDSIASDGAGNLFVTDAGLLVRQIVVATGVVTTLAGNLISSGVVDGVGSAGHFNLPRGAVSDHAGNLYVADFYGRTIRKIVVATATVTTIAGGAPGSTDGTGKAARFQEPEDLAYDFAGHLFVFDTGTIRQIDLATTVVTTLAGAAGETGSVDAVGTAARFNTAGSLGSDGAGNLYVTDSKNFTIRRIVTATAAVTTLAGAPTPPGTADGIGAQAGFSDPRGMVTDGAGTLYICDGDSSVIRKIDIGTRAVTTLAGTLEQSGSTDGIGAAARFFDPQDLTLDGQGQLYVADTLNATIRQITLATGAVTTIAGTAGALGSADGMGAAARFRSPSGIASDGTGNLYVGDAGNATIRKVELATGIVTTVAGSVGVTGAADGTGGAATFTAPTALAFDGAGDLLVSDHGSATIRKLVVATGVVTTLAGTAGQSGTDDGTGAAARFIAPWGLVSDGADTVYVTDDSGNTVRKITVSTGAVTTLLGIAGRAGVRLGPLPGALNFPLGIARQPDGVLFVTSEGAVLAAR